MKKLAVRLLEALVLISFAALPLGAQTTGSTPPSCCSTVMWCRSNWPRIISRLPAIACCRSTRSTAA